jgi:hypothetical protein
MNPAFITLLVIVLILVWVGIRFLRSGLRFIGSADGARAVLNGYSLVPPTRAAILEAATRIRNEDTRMEAEAELLVLRAELREVEAFARWAREQLRGESGVGESHWEQFAEYRSGSVLLDRKG